MDHSAKPVALVNESDASAVRSAEPPLRTESDIVTVHVPLLVKPLVSKAQLFNIFAESLKSLPSATPKGTAQDFRLLWSARIRYVITSYTACCSGGSMSEAITGFGKNNSGRAPAR